MVNLIKKQSKYNFDDTNQKILSFLKERNITVFAILDHTGNAHSANLKLRPEKLIIFGTPAVGTYIIDENPEVGLFLPSKVLIYENNGKVFITHEDYSNYQNEFNLKRSIQYLKKLEALFDELDNAIS